MKTNQRKLELSLNENVHENINIGKNNGIIKVEIGEILVCAYSDSEIDFSGQIIPIRKESISGFLCLNSHFFNKIGEWPSRQEDSQMMNLAKGFFNVNKKNHVSLVQYLKEGEISSEHYHTLEETIIQLAGRSIVVTRQKDNDIDYKLNELNPGDKIRISPNTIHFLRGFEEDSLIGTIKQTKRKSDHYYQPYTQKRILMELNNLASEHYENGFDSLIAVKEFYDSLKTDTERKNTINLIEEKIRSSNNNTIFHGFKEKYPN